MPDGALGQNFISHKNPQAVFFKGNLMVTLEKAVAVALGMRFITRDQARRAKHWLKATNYLVIFMGL